VFTELKPLLKQRVVMITVSVKRATFRVLDGALPGLLFRSVGLFVDAFGFRMRRTSLAKKPRN